MGYFEMARAKTFREKLADQKDFPRVEPISPGMARKWGPGTVVIPSPREVDEFMRRVPKGKLVTVNEIRRAAAERHGATIACPMTTGILARVAAGAAGEDEAEGIGPVTPYWRTLKSGGEVNPKYPGGVEGQSDRLIAEGHRVDMRGNRAFVVDYENHLVTLGTNG
jgi:alkylated DNA nucleotide flippase Atl1